ncbi:MAG TPA: copper resistance CopC family protein [Methylocella sp.]|nr:copper resistance CopC family protein [Methylocella sp.]
MKFQSFLLVAVAALIQAHAPCQAAAYADVPRSEIAQPPSVPAVGVPPLDLQDRGRPMPNAANGRLRLAHAIIVRTSPEKGGVAPQNIGKVEVWYDAGIRSEFVALAVINAAGDRVDKHDAAIDLLDPAHVSTSVDTLTPGEYTVRYRAISADGHQVSGAWVFEVNEH